ncbi:MAG: hypothetical protein Q9196_004032, partial [Gyalolechia fulgens]
MRIFHPRWMALAALSIAIALLPQLAALSPENRKVTTEHIVHEARASTVYQTLLQALKPKVLQRARVQARSPVETPPTAYLPYPPPPNY